MSSWNVRKKKLALQTPGIAAAEADVNENRYLSATYGCLAKGSTPSIEIQIPLSLPALTALHGLTWDVRNGFDSRWRFVAYGLRDGEA